MDVKKKFNPSYQFLKFVGTSCVTALATKYIMDCMDDTDPNLAALDSLDNKYQIEILDQAASHVVDFEWHDISRAIRQERYICWKHLTPTTFLNF